MNTPIILSPQQDSLRKYALFGYVMHLLGLVSIIGFVIGLIITWIKREDAVGTIYLSHFNWQSRSFWWFVFWFVLLWIPTLLTAFLVPFFILAQVWLAYRLIKGLMRLNQGREIA
jgi:uncharacterized membrane protein